MYSLKELKNADIKITIIDKFDYDKRHVVDINDIDDGFCIKECIEEDFGINDFSESKKYPKDEIIKFLVSFACMDCDNYNHITPGTYRIRSKIAAVNNIVGNC